MKYTFATKYNESVCHKCYMDGYVYIDDVPYCWSHFLQHVKITDKNNLKRALQRLHSIESDKFENWVNNFKGKQ